MEIRDLELDIYEWNNSPPVDLQLILEISNILLWFFVYFKLVLIFGQQFKNLFWVTLPPQKTPQPNWHYLYMNKNKALTGLFFFFSITLLLK